VSIALGSHAELETCFETARRLNYISEQELQELVTVLDRAGQLLSALFRALDSRSMR